MKQKIGPIALVGAAAVVIVLIYVLYSRFLAEPKPVAPALMPGPGNAQNGQPQKGSQGDYYMKQYRPDLQKGPSK